jgi:hypothetical protein
MMFVKIRLSKTLCMNVNSVQVRRFLHRQSGSTRHHGNTNATPTNKFALVPIFGAVVGTIALTFQISVLYPWHHELSHQFEQVEVSPMHIMSYIVSII